MKFSKFTIHKKGVFTKRYKVYHEGELYYRVSSDGFNRGLHIVNNQGREVLTIKKKFSWTGSIIYNILVNEELRATISAKSLSISHKMEVDSIGGLFFIEGNIWANSFTIEDAYQPIAQIARNWYKNPRYGIAILPGRDDLMIIGLVLCIDLVINVKKARS